MYFGKIKALQKQKEPKIFCCSRVSQVVLGEKLGIWPTRIAARRQPKLLCVMVIQDLKWHVIENVNTEGIDVTDILEETGTMFESHCD